MTSRTKAPALLGALAALVAAAAATALLRDTADAAGEEGGTVRRHFIQAEEVAWSYAPDRRDRTSGEPFAGEARVFLERGRDRIGAVYRKALFRG
jgi:hypothetical protein